MDATTMKRIILSRNARCTTWSSIKPVCTARMRSVTPSVIPLQINRVKRTINHIFLCVNAGSKIHLETPGNKLFLPQPFKYLVLAFTDVPAKVLIRGVFSETLKCWGLGTRFQTATASVCGLHATQQISPNKRVPPSTKHCKDPCCVLRGGTHPPQCCLHKPKATLLCLHLGTSQPHS